MSERMDEPDLPRIAGLISDVLKVFRGQPNGAVHAALVNLTADFIVGHEMVGERDTTQRMRQMLIVEHFRMVKQLVDAYERKKDEQDT